MTSFCQRINTQLSFVAVEDRETSPILALTSIDFLGSATVMTYMYNDVGLCSY